jgi:hypothetical protein
MTASLSSEPKRPPSKITTFGGLGLGLLLFLPAALCACGRQATAEDCKVIYEKNVEVEMRSLEKADEPTIERKKADLKTAFDGELKSCVGKRITDSVMACIRAAKTSDEMTRCGSH